MLGTYWGICVLNGYVFPINHATNNTLFSHTLNNNLLHLGLFPWALYACIAAGMGVLAHRQQTNAFVSQLIKPVTKQGPQETWSLITNIGARRSTLIAFGVTLMFATLLFVSFIPSITTHLAYGFKQPALLMTLFLLAIAGMSKIVKRHTSRVFSRNIPTALGFPIFCLVLGAILLFLSLIMTGLTEHAKPAVAPPLVVHWIQQNWHMTWMIFTVMWWLCFTPAVASYFARISKGYRIRDMILGILVLPILITLLFILRMMGSV